MLTWMTKGKVLVFVVIAVATTTFLAVKYVGLDRYIGGYRVTVAMPHAGGLFEGSEVAYRGVPVGLVESLHADLPPSIDGLLRSSRDLLDSIPSDALNTVIDETYEFTRGNGQNLARMLETSASFAETADRNFLTTVSLIDNSGQVLATQEAAAASFQSFSKDLNLLAHSLEDQDKDWRRVVRSTPAAARELDRLFGSVGAPLGQLMSNLITTAEVFGTNAAGVKETMIRLPEGISITYAVMTSKGMQSGLQLSFFNPLPCVQGYEGTPMRPGLDTSAGEPFNTEAGCTAPPSSGINVRGPQVVLGGERTPVSSAESLQDLMGGTQ